MRCQSVLIKVKIKYNQLNNNKNNNNNNKRVYMQYQGNAVLQRSKRPYRPFLNCKKEELEKCRLTLFPYFFSYCGCTPLFFYSTVSCCHSNQNLLLPNNPDQVLRVLPSQALPKRVLQLRQQKATTRVSLVAFYLTHDCV